MRKKFHYDFSVGSQMQKKQSELYWLKREFTRMKAQYRAGYKMGEKLLKEGADIGRGSVYWFKKADAWKEGYQDGWRAALNQETKELA